MEINQFIIPKHIKIEDYEFSFKNQLSNDKFSYRCKYRMKCKLTIKIAKEELKKYNDDNNYIMKYE